MIILNLAASARPKRATTNRRREEGMGTGAGSGEVRIVPPTKPFALNGFPPRGHNPMAGLKIKLPIKGDPGE